MAIGGELVGRTEELSTVCAALRAAGDSPLLIVAGEAGIGKSHLVGTGATRAQDLGSVVLRGWCLDLQQELPFLPVVDVIRDLATRDERRLLKAALAACPAYVEHEISALVPELELDAAADDTVVEQWRRERVFGAIALLLRAAAELAPIVIVIEDVHWVDPSTQDLLRYLAAPSHASGVPIVLTARSEDAGAAWLGACEA